MSSKTKIIVLHMREVVYTAVFLLLAIILAVVVGILSYAAPKIFWTEE